MKSLFVGLLLAFLITAAHSFQTSSESVNPFNLLMSPSGGVNMYSGDAAYSYPVTSVSGRGGMNINVALSYSSNIYLNVRSRNDVAPTSWVGLGWNLNYGSIVCNHKGTKTHDDDDLIWISPAGFSSKILKKNGKYYIKDDPYTKIEPQAGSDSVFTGWIMTTTDGQKAKYGNLGFTDNRNSTRWTFAWGNYVGMGSAGTPTQYPYQWDLSEIADLSGNAVKYYYQQDTEYVKVGSWTSPTWYTKASYPFKIVTPEGKRVEFTLESKGNEAYDPYTFQNEPDGFMEMFESRRLSQIKAFLIPDSTSAVSTYKFTYDTIWRRDNHEI